MRVILALLLMLSVAPAWADWAKVSEEDGIAFYIDPATVRKAGNLRRVSGLQDLTQNGFAGVLSKRTLEEYDCVEEKTRIVLFFEYSGLMGNGEILRWFRPPVEWVSISPGMHSAKILAIVCAK
jgi:hypothetical protein